MRARQHLSTGKIGMNCIVGAHYQAIGQALLGLLLAGTLTLARPALAASITSPTSLSFAADGAIRLEINKGDVEVIGVEAAKIAVSWQADVARNADVGDVNVELRRLGDNEASVLVDGPDRVHYRIEIPRRSDVAIHMRAGELDAKPWQTEKAGLWRSFKLEGDGEYDLRARLIAGQLTIRAD